MVPLSALDILALRALRLPARVSRPCVPSYLSTGPALPPAPPDLPAFPRARVSGRALGVQRVQCSALGVYSRRYGAEAGAAPDGRGRGELRRVWTGGSTGWDELGERCAGRREG